LSLIASCSLCVPQPLCSPDLAFALVGRYYTLNPFDNVEIVPIAEQFLNPDWDSETRENDHTVLLLSHSVDGYIKINLDDNLEVDELTIIGLGWTNPAVYSPPQFLQEVTVEFVSNHRCEKAKAKGFSYNDLIYDDMMCLHGTESGSGQCQGDSGGPVLLLYENEEDIQVAIMSSYGSRFSLVRTRVDLKNSNFSVVCILFLPGGEDAPMPSFLL
jgi:hypothetical protein